MTCCSGLHPSVCLTRPVCFKSQNYWRVRPGFFTVARVLSVCVNLGMSLSVEVDDSSKDAIEFVTGADSS